MNTSHYPGNPKMFRTCKICAGIHNKGVGTNPEEEKTKQ
jgi:hypothetical protein